MKKLYGKAGVPLTADEIRERQSRRNRSRTLIAQATARHDAEAKAGWAAGLVRPYLLTQWLDYRGLDGPEVDTACGVAEPTVDLWEEGRVYPSWEQLQALARLCGIHPVRFVRTEEHDGPLFMCGRGAAAAYRAPDPVYRFDPLALAAAGIQPYPEPAGDGRLF